MFIPSEFTDAVLAERARALGEALAVAGWSVSLAESCTGGWVAKCLTDIAGSSDWFDRAWVTYSNAAKTVELGVPETLLAEAGAVSEPVVRAMADGARRRSGADLAVAISGVAGPGGGTKAKPVGTVCLALADASEGCKVTTRQFDGDRDGVRRASVAFALQWLIDHVMSAEAGKRRPDN